MTGYGRSTKNFSDKVVTVDIRSLNSKYLDLNLRLPALLKSREIELRRIITERILRGKTEITISIEYLLGEALVKINKPLINSYLNELKEIADIAGIQRENLIYTAMRLPGATQSIEELADREWDQVMEVMEEALLHFDEFRNNEGLTIDKVLRAYAHNIAIALGEIEKLLPQRHEAMKTKLQSGFNEFNSKAEMDANRFEQELIYYLERLDVSEEIVRLKSHLDQYFNEMDNEFNQKGRKLGFITQEMGREINTIGSKANYALIQSSVITMKDELEKIKEQLSNIL